MNAAPEVIEDGFPYQVLPTGWFQVAWSDDLTAGEVRPLRYFDTDLVLYRAEDGTAVVLDARCPHMGAHLGYGGRVEGCDIVCPFHGWQWAPNGHNTMVPSDGCATDRRRIGTWAVRETNGIVWVWYDDAGREPQWEPLEEHREDRDFLPIFPHCVHRWENVHARPQYMMENVVDLDHFPWVHKNRGTSEVTETRDKGHVLEIDMDTVYGAGKKATWATPNGPVATTVTTYLHGVATLLTDWGPGTDGSLLITNGTPIDLQHMDIFMTVLVCQDPESSSDVPEGRALKRIDEQRKQTERDVPIWHNLAYVAKPPYSRIEGKRMVEVKRWASRFYPSDRAGQAAVTGDAISVVA